MTNPKSQPTPEQILAMARLHNSPFEAPINEDLASQLMKEIQKAFEAPGAGSTVMSGLMNSLYNILGRWCDAEQQADALALIDKCSNQARAIVLQRLAAAMENLSADGSIDLGNLSTGAAKAATDAMDVLDRLVKSNRTDEGGAAPFPLSPSPIIKS